ncbi:DUF7520 family protein [Natrinema amylolyticum]|uniref:DUF7520 family protein n=1 Tax=Natrinema amylolyticum TaxID=2878679 RepID=UPI001CF9E7B5|nr:hypothetical protein [Natrinema amylolyticum]
MLDARTIAGRRAVVALAIALVTATAAFGALLGATLPARTGLEEITVRSIVVPVSPVTLAVYGAVAVGALLVMLGLVVVGLSRFDDAT